jgi:rhodanese-related sulfurtransferase
MKSNMEISVEEARYNYQKGLYDYVVDVRTEKEWTQHHLPHTIHIPIGTLVTELPEKIPDRNARILFICKKGIRASAVTVIANKLGYYNVQSMIGNYKQLLL